MSRTIKFAKPVDWMCSSSSKRRYPPLARTKSVKFKAIGINRAESMWPKDATR